MKITNKIALIFLLAGSTFGMDIWAATTWDVSLWGKRRAFTEHVEKLAELVNAKTNGDFTLNISYGGLAKNKENLDGIAAGQFEMAQFCSFYHRTKNPTLTVSELPFSRDLSLKQVADIELALFAHPIVKQDLARWNATLLMPTPLPQYNIMASNGKAPETLSIDLIALKMRGPGGIIGVLRQLGVFKIDVPAGQVREAMDNCLLYTSDAADE